MVGIGTKNTPQVSPENTPADLKDSTFGGPATRVAGVFDFYDVPKVKDEARQAEAIFSKIRSRNEPEPSGYTVSSWRQAADLVDHVDAIRASSERIGLPKDSYDALSEIKDIIGKFKEAHPTDHEFRVGKGELAVPAEIFGEAQKELADLANK